MDRRSELSRIARTELVERVRTAGGEPEVSLDVVRFGLGDLVARCQVAQVDRSLDRVATAVEIEMALRPDSREGIRENSIGVAPDDEQAVRRAVQLWVEGVLPPVRAALGLGPQERVQPFRLSQTDPHGRNGRRWRVFGGAIQVTTDDPEPLIRCLDSFPPFPYMAEQGGLPLFPEENGIFWMRISCSRDAEGDLDGTCRVNNIEWPLGIEVLSRLPWPPGLGPLMVRQFFAGKPLD